MTDPLYPAAPYRAAMLSMWRDDIGRGTPLAARVGHLLGKSYPGLRWVWVVGDCQDGTEAALRELAAEQPGKDIEIILHDTEILGTDPTSRLRQLSETASAGLERVRAEDDFWIIHESDLVSPMDLVERFLTTAFADPKVVRCPIAGWVTLGECFYDIWAYRAKGKKFQNDPPYHAVFQPGGVFEVESVGSCWMFFAEDLRAGPLNTTGVRCEQWGAVEMCEKFRARGRRIWVDPRIRIVQPKELWVASEPAPR